MLESLALLLAGLLMLAPAAEVFWHRKGA